MTLFLIVFLAILIVILCFQYIPGNGPELPKYNHDVSAVEYVLDNPDLLISELGFSDNTTWHKQNKVEYDYILPIDLYTYPSGTERAYFIDINGENGYLIVDADNNLYQYQTIGDYPQLTDAETICFSPYDGILYTYKGKNYLVSNSLQSVPDRWENARTYSGQKTFGEGDIFQPNSYVQDRYGMEYEIAYSQTLRNFTFVTQAETTVYYRNRGGRSEGNCTLNALYQALNYIGTTEYGGTLPSNFSFTKVDARNDPFYAKYASDPTCLIDTPKTLPELYANIRSYAISAHNYEVEALSQVEFLDVARKMIQQYNCPVNVENYNNPTYVKQVIEPISNGFPVMNNVTGSITYGSHSMVVTGYQIYRNTTNIGQLHRRDYILMLQIADGWSASPRYYDANFSKKLEIVTVFSKK